MQTLSKPDGAQQLEPDRDAHQAGHTSHDAITDNAITVTNLTKRYGSHVAVDDLSFAIPRGAVAGLIGPNGAGKTTLMAMLLGLVRPSAGSGTVLGHPVDRPADYLPQVGASIEVPAFHSAVSGIDNLRALSLLSGCDQSGIPGLIDRVGLGGRGDDAFGSYSMGMKQRLAIAAALLGDPEVVILDEPTNGLDPAGMKDIRRLIGDIAADGRTLLVSSHLLSELEQVSDWLVVIDHGGLVYLGPPEFLAGTESLVIGCADPNQLGGLQSMVASTNLPIAVVDDEIIVTLNDDVDPRELAAEINRRAHIGGILLSELHHQRAGLEARYLDLISNAKGNQS